MFLIMNFSTNGFVFSFNICSNILGPQLNTQQIGSFTNLLLEREELN